jgi:hypothetical protein
LLNTGSKLPGGSRIASKLEKNSSSASGVKSPLSGEFTQKRFGEISRHPARFARRESSAATIKLLARLPRKRNPSFELNHKAQASLIDLGRQNVAGRHTVEIPRQAVFG